MTRDVEIPPTSGARGDLGMVGGLDGVVDDLLARGQSYAAGRPLREVQADLAARRARTEAGLSQSPLERLASASDPTKPPRAAGRGARVAEAVREPAR